MVSHTCEEGEFMISGGTKYIDRIGSMADYEDSNVFQHVIAVHKIYNIKGLEYVGPKQDVA